MPIVTGQLSVGTASPTAVNNPSVNPARLHVHNNDNTNNLLIGNGSITVNNGMIVPKLDSIELVLNPLEVVYLLASGGTITASYLMQTE